MTAPIFNSLGSNYTPELIALASQFQPHPTKDQSAVSKKLTERLGNHFGGETLLTYKGRDAIELALKPLAELNMQQGVLTQGLACHAIEEGILRAGLIPIYVDLEANTLCPSVKTLELGMRRAKELGVTVTAVFLQHTLGYSNPVSEIATFCQNNRLILIEDLAQSFGAADSSGVELGTFADVVVCSFGRDKVLDAVSGGAVIYKESYWEKVGGESKTWIAQHQPTEEPPAAAVRKELQYPALTDFIRRTHQIGIGKLLFKLAKMFGLLTSPISTPVEHPTLLPAGYSRLVLWQLDHLEEQLKHRRQIAEIYLQLLKPLQEAVCLVDPAQLNTDIHLRVPLLFSSPEMMRKVIAECTAQNIHITDRWYRTVVDSGSLNYSTLYQLGDCPNAEAVAARLLNLPTHLKISAGDAERVAQVIIDTVQKN